MPSLTELATEMVITRAKTTPLTAEEMVADLNRFHSALRKLEAGASEESAETAATEPAPPPSPATPPVVSS